MMTGPVEFSRQRKRTRPGWAYVSAATSTAAPGIRRIMLCASLLLLVLAGALSARADVTEPVVDVEPVELLSDAALSILVAPVALYPDDLLAIVLPASTFPLQVVLAARFLEARASEPDLQPNEDWDASIVALLNYPEVIALLDENLQWARLLGEAVLFQQEDVIAAVAGFREQAAAAGNLESDDKQQVSVSDEGAIEITPVEREIIHVPYYDPDEVTTYQPTRVYHYYPRSYPVYYYPYPSGHYFSQGPFWGVTSAFSIGWHTRSLHWHHRGFNDHPYFGFTYYEPFYFRRPHFRLSYYHQDRPRRHDRRHHDDNRWRNDDRRGGSRPGHRYRRPGRDAGPDGTDRRPPRDRAIDTPAGQGARGIERTIAAMPGKQSGHIPVRAGAQTRNAPGDSKKSSARSRADGPTLARSPRQRTSNTASSRQQAARPSRSRGAATAPTAPAANRALSASQRRAQSARATATPRAPRSVLRRPAAVDRPERQPARQSRQPAARPAPSRQAPRVSTTIRRPSVQNRAATTTVRPAQVKAPRTVRPASVREPARSTSSRAKQQQRPAPPERPVRPERSAERKPRRASA